jgi:polysaccharide pyruvyl transferase WcaK-like protein
MKSLNQMKSETVARDIGNTNVAELLINDAGSAHRFGEECPQTPKIALLTPYTGGNLGDAAIQDAAIANIRLRLPGAQFSGITLNCRNFLEQHGSSAFPLVGAGVTFFKMDTEGVIATADLKHHRAYQGRIRNVLRNLPGARAIKQYLKRSWSWRKVIQEEIRHSVAGYRFLRTQDLLLVSGGGQLDEEYGGAWGLPFALFKWAALARLARIPCAMASVGAGKIALPASRRLISAALRLCCYRSFRETKSRLIAAKLFPRAVNDPVVPDLAFSLPLDSELHPAARGIRALARGRDVIALSPMAYAKPINWPTPDQALHDRYVQQMARLLSCLAQRDYFIVVVCSSLGDDEAVIPDIVGRLSREAKHSLEGRIHFPKIKTWRELVATLRETECVIASRLHGTILGFVAQVPAVAISVDPKVDWVMEDLHQSDFLLHIRDFTAEDVLDALDRMKDVKITAVEQIASYRQAVLSNSDSRQQYDFLAGLALKHHQSHH